MIASEGNIIPLFFWASFEKNRKQRARIRKMSQCLELPFQFELEPARTFLQPHAKTLPL
jgi:hypothetical protein